MFRFALAAVLAVGGVATDLAFRTDMVFRQASAQSAAGSTAPAVTPEVKVADNVFVVPDQNAKRVTAWLIVRAGCADEYDGDCRGIAHYLEHLLFINRDADHKSKVAMFPGGTGNGVTNSLTTYYVQSFPAGSPNDAINLDKLIGHFAGLLVDVRATDDQAKRERNVVVQEVEGRISRNPQARFWIARNAALLPGDSLGQNVGGTTDGIRAFTMEDAKAFHKTWYHKSNATLVLHGPIDTEAVRPMIDRHFSHLPATPVPPHVWSKARPQPLETVRLDTSDAEVRDTTVYLDRLISYVEPTAAADRRLAIAARNLTNMYLASRVAGSPADTLLEQDGLVSQASVSFTRLREGQLRLTYAGVPADGVSPDSLLAAMRAELRRQADRGVSPEVVERLKTRQRVGRALLREEPERYANALVGWFASHNSITSWHEIDANAARVTAADLTSILRLLASPGRDVVGVLRPVEKPSPSDGTAPPAAVPPCRRRSDACARSFLPSSQLSLLCPPQRNIRPPISRRRRPVASRFSTDLIR